MHNILLDIELMDNTIIWEKAHHANIDSLQASILMISNCLLNSNIHVISVQTEFRVKYNKTNGWPEIKFTKHCYFKYTFITFYCLNIYIHWVLKWNLYFTCMQ